jgi:hypothetical protein
MTKETGFFAVLSTVTKYSRKNPVSEHPFPTQETGFFGVLSTVTKYSRKNPVSDHPYISLILLT